MPTATEANPIEKLHEMFCKQLLGVNKTTTTDRVRLELGRLPLLLFPQKAAVNNWERVGKKNLTPCYMNLRNAQLMMLRIKTMAIKRHASSLPQSYIKKIQIL